MNEENSLQSSSSSNAYILPLSIILASLIISGSVLFAASKVDSSITGLVVGNQAPAPQQLAPSNNPAPQNNPTLQQPPSSNVTLATFKDIPNSRREGATNAKVTIVEFSDFQCPFCERFYTDSYQQIKKDYLDTGKSVQFIFANFPLSFHPNAQPAANAAACAEEQGKFWDYHDKLFTNQTSLGDASYKQWAQDLGLNAAQFNTCYDTKKYDNTITAETRLGSQVGVSGTPTIYIVGPKGSQQIVGAQPYATFKAAIEAALAQS